MLGWFLFFRGWAAWRAMHAGKGIKGWTEPKTNEEKAEPSRLTFIENCV